MSWKKEQVETLYEMPFMDLMHKARTVHQAHFKPNQVQASALLSIKTGACPEDCAYCTQSGHHNTGLKKEKLMSTETVVQAAKNAKAAGATRFCMGAAWRHIPDKSMAAIKEMIGAVKALGMETCVTLGMLKEAQAQELKAAGLDYYNHNLDTSESYYQEIITTRTYQDRFDTLDLIKKAGINVCCGGIVGMGETREDRVELLMNLANQDPAPQSVPINQLIPMPGTPLADTPPIDDFEFIRTIAIARIMMPTSYVRLSAGREAMSKAVQAWCFYAGANSIHCGDVLLTAGNQNMTDDRDMFKTLGLEFEPIPG